MVFLVIGLIITILIFSGIFASIPRKENMKSASSSATTNQEVIDER